jgi:predicted aspartyl protease
MGKVKTPVTITNLADAWAARAGRLADDQVRAVAVADALVDTGATTLALPSALIRRLGLLKRYDKPARTAAGLTTVSVYDAVRVEIDGRECTVDPMEVPDEVGVLVGQILLEMMDFVVDPRGQRLTGNPDHGGHHMLDLL